MAGSGFALVLALLAATVMLFFPSSASLCVLWSNGPCLLGGIICVAFSGSNALGMLAGICMASQSMSVPFICAFGLASSTVGSSMSKRMVRNSMTMIAYAVSNIISPQMWTDSTGPKYIPAWVVMIVVSWFAAPGLIGTVGLVLRHRNKERHAYIKRHPEELQGHIFGENGEDILVPKSALDLTDLEDKTYIYKL